MIRQRYLGVVMLLRIVTAAILATACGVSAGSAQSVAQVGGPRELPPGSFTGQQYVDSRGCVFLRAGYGGQVNWVPRVSSQRRALCGFPPSFGPKPVIEMADEAPAPAPVVAAPAPRVAAAPAAPRNPGRPIDTVASITTPPKIRAAAPTSRVPVESYTAPVVVTRPAPYADTRPAGSYETAASGPSAGKIGCFSSAPVAERVRLSNGGTAVVCTRGDGGVSGWRPPIYPTGAGVGAALSDPRVAHHHREGGPSGRAVAVDGPGYASSTAIPTPPKGYVLAWDDDRLNPNRARGTAAGQAAQDQIWTREVPARLVADVAKKKPRVATKQVTVSTKSSPTAAVPKAAAPKGSGGAFVQVGTFGVPANASGAAQRLAALGLPTARGKITKGGKALQIVYAGPFGSSAEAQSALSAARRAGFSDAFIR